MAKYEPLEYSKKRLAQVVALNAQGVSVPGLAHAFGMKSPEQETEIRNDIQTLLQEGLAHMDRKGLVTSKKPISDLVIARVSKSLTDNAKKIKLDIQGVEADFPFSVTLSTKQLKKFPGMTLRTGDTVAVILDRSNVVDLKARLHAKVKYKKPLTISGKLSPYSNEPVFRPYDNGITTTFRISGELPETFNRKASYNAAIPLNMDPYNPALEAIEQKWDPETGASIALVIAEKYNIKKLPPKDAYLDAKESLRRPPPFDNRRDLRHEKICVIDPKKAADHDDGILVERTKDGYRTLVVIADVAHYVRPGTALDQSARERGFSYYFEDETIHMLPHKLTMGASLLKGELRPVVYCEKFWDEHGREIRHKREIGLGIIQSQMQFTYHEFEGMLDEYNPLVLDYGSFGDIVTERMFKTAKALMFEESEDNETAPRSKGLVAAMMIDTNIALSELLGAHDIPFPSRVHGAISDEVLLDEAAQQLEEWGYMVPDSSSLMDVMELHDILAQADARHERPKIESFIKANLLQRAHYSIINTGHFCLQTRDYAHGTSPVRRYADILVQRALHTILQNPECGLSDENVEMLGQTTHNLNHLQDVGRAMHNDNLKYYAVRDLYRLEGCSVKAEIHAITPYGVGILLPHNRGLRKIYKPNELPEGWTLSKRGNSLIYNNIEVGEGSKIRLRIANVRPTEAQWDAYNLEPVAIIPPARGLKSRHAPARTLVEPRIA